MKKRQIIILAVAALILVLGKLGKDAISQPKERDKPLSAERVVTVFTDVVELSDVPVLVKTTGSLEAKDRMDLYSEVQGLMLPDNGRFRAGNTFNKGETLIQLRADDARARVVSQRSAFERSLSGVMADIRLDHPDDYPKWVDYLKRLDVNAALPPLPEVSSTKLKSYLTGRDIYSTYYTTRQAEISLTRYRIVAPFTGVLTEAMVNPGTVVRQGQLLGRYIKPGVFEIKASVDINTAENLQIGQKVTLFKESDPGTAYNGEIVRVNPQIDRETQMSDFFVSVRSNELTDGEFMRVEVTADPTPDAYEISRSALKDGRYAFVVEDGQLRMLDLSIMHRTESTAIVRGLKNGQHVLTKLPPAVFDGMKVNIYSEEKVK